jgi:hypothetical protein
LGTFSKELTKIIKFKLKMQKCKTSPNVFSFKNNKKKIQEKKKKKNQMLSLK